MHECTQVRNCRAAKKHQEVVHFYCSLEVDYWGALCKKKGLHYMEIENSIAPQLLRYWNKVLGAIGLHSIINPNEGLCMGTG